MRNDRFELPLRIVMASPPKGVAIAMQEGRDALLPPSATSGHDLIFDFDVVVEGVAADGRPRVLGRVVQGPPLGRFVYVNSGTYAGDGASPWARRAKVPLSTLDWAAIEALKPGQRLEARFFGQDRCGGPACASVKLLPPGWTAA
jgi:hypothetical protein